MVLIQKMQDQEKVQNYLTYGLTNYDLVNIAKANEPMYNIDVWLGKENSVNVYTNQDIYKTIKKAKKKLLKVSVKYDGPVEAPINKGDKDCNS